jgi:hypothetical protein
LLRFKDRPDFVFNEDNKGNAAGSGAPLDSNAVVTDFVDVADELKLFSCFEVLRSNIANKSDTLAKARKYVAVCSKLSPNDFVLKTSDFEVFLIHFEPSSLNARQTILSSSISLTQNALAVTENLSWVNEVRD